MVAMDFFAASNSYDFIKSVLFKFAEKSDGESVKQVLHEINTFV